MNINAMMQQAKKMQAEIEKAQKELGSKEFVVEKQGIKITFLGNRKIKSVEINKILIDPDDKEILEDMVMIAINEVNEIIDKEFEKIQPNTPNMPF